MKKLITICLVLLICASSAYATKIASADDSTAIAAVHVDVDILEILNSDELALLQAGGNIWYVDNAATGSGTAADWTNADITIELALVHAAANAGDIIVCAPYHVETASTGTFDLDKDGVKVIGLGTGDAMTTITYDTTTDTVLMGAGGDGCTIRNIKFYTATDNIVSAIIVEDGCTDFIIEDCVFEATSTDEFLDAIYIHGTSANEGIIRRNRFLGDIASNTAPQSSIGFEDAHWLQIYDNEFTGDMGVAHIENKTAASNFITIRDNRFLCGYIGDAASTLDTVPGITLVATTTGWIQDNTIVTNVVSPDLAIVAADAYIFGNTYSELQGSTARGFSGVGKRNICVATTGAMTSTNYGQVTAPIFTVTGDILCRATATFSTKITTDSNAGTLELGVVGNTAILLVQDQADNTAFDVGMTWTKETAADADGALMADEWTVVSGGTIGLKIVTQDCAGGVANFYLEWVGLSANAHVVAAAL